MDLLQAPVKNSPYPRHCPVEIFKRTFKTMEVTAGNFREVFFQPEMRFPGRGDTLWGQKMPGPSPRSLNRPLASLAALQTHVF